MKIALPLAISSQNPIMVETQQYNDIVGQEPQGEREDTAVSIDMSMVHSTDQDPKLMLVQRSGNIHRDVGGSDNQSIDSHTESHFGNVQIMRDVIIGLSDGLTVPFALAAGLAALDNSRLVVTAGLAEIVAGSISMGLGGYLAGLSEIEHYDSERIRESYEVDHMPEREAQEIREIFQEYQVEGSVLDPLIEHLSKDKELWVDFMVPS